MEFTEPYPCSGPPPAWSPDGSHLAVFEGGRVVVYDAALRRTGTWATLGPGEVPTRLAWNAQSRFLAAVLPHLVHVWDVLDPEWLAIISEASLAIADARFSPCGRHLCVLIEHGIRFSLYDLTTGEASHVAWPHPSVRTSAVLATCAEGLALLGRDPKQGRSHLWVLSHRRPAQTAPLPEGFEPAGVFWSLAGAEIQVLGAGPAYSVLAYRWTAGQWALALRHPDEQRQGASPEGGAEQAGLAKRAPRSITRLAASPALLALGERGGAVRLLERLTCSFLGPLGFAPTSPARLAFFRERGGVYESEDGRTLPAARLPAEIAWLAWAGDGRYLAARLESEPHRVYVWNIALLELVAVLDHASAIRHAAWGPEGHTLAILTASRHLFLWSGEEEGGEAVAVPFDGFSPARLAWHDAQGLVLVSASSFCLAQYASG